MEEIIKLQLEHLYRQRMYLLESFNKTTIVAYRSDLKDQIDIIDKEVERIASQLDNSTITYSKHPIDWNAMVTLKDSDQ